MIDGGRMKMKNKVRTSAFSRGLILHSTGCPSHCICQIKKEKHKDWK
jgi:hypothetical protein